MNLKNDFKKYICQTSAEPMGLEIERAEGPYLFTKSGEKYLDLLAGIGVANIGHGRNEIIQAIQKQAAAYLHPMVYGEVVQEQQVLYARKLAEVLPGKIDNIFFTNSGAEAIEGTLKTARKFTGRQEIFSFSGAYHGDTFGALSLQDNPRYRQAFEPTVPQVASLPWNDIACLDQISENTAAVILEPIQAEGGVRVPSREFMHALRRRCTETGALLIADEVMTGFGRTGALFAVQHFDVEPDLIALAKALGGGMPLGAFAGPQKILNTLSENPPLAHVTTFGGHPVCCAAGLAGLEILLNEKLSERAKTIGDYFLSNLHELVSENKNLIEVRGLGCLIGIVFKNAEKTQEFARKCMDAKIIVGWTLFHPNIIRLAPPLILSDDELKLAFEKMRRILNDLQD
ncbi:MAG: aspartate aminotransferase family protein [Calditrichaeota bacterium]|nr:MAG: aspartate aminotransferase family protein [Calditrichota bacterium]